MAKPVAINQLKAALTQWCRVETVPEPLPAAAKTSVTSRLRGRYLERRDATLAGVAALARPGDVPAAELVDILEQLHKLAGTAAMFGEEELGKQAAALEDGLSSWSADERIGRIKTMLSLELSQAA